ncbi:DUF441 domain-containing protein [Tepidibacter aestuarii]|uniref:DUF441 domain-containing protein n=1 Tax=Tepidibacter aestuarii TaxID=2925782 RepID=UPI0020BF7708|nr:DUF441 family protein [Tepidibacter aestuarii]CAH2213756.1 conserved membrane protein of unknown function [Tepidibacter aestuarii]
MDQSYIILLIILTLSLFIKNDSLSISASILILLKLLKLNSIFPKLEANGLKIGIIVLTIGILTPIAADKYSLKDILVSIKSPLGISAIVASSLIMMFTGQGYELLISSPSIVIPIVLGSILGIVLFKGIPIGPLVSAGVTLIIYNLFTFIQKLLP